VNVTGAATNNGTINVYGQSHYSRVNLKAASVSNNGTINFKGGTGSNAAKLSITGNLTNETNGTITIEGGSGSIAYAALYADGELTNNGSILLEDGAGYAAFAGVAAQTITNNGTIAGPGLLIADTAFTCENGSWLKPGGYGANKFARLSMAGNFSFMAGSNIEILLGTAMNQSGSLGSHPLFGGLLPPPVVTFNGTTTIHVAKAVANSTTSGQNQTYEIIEANTIDTNGAATGDGARSATAGADGTIVLDNVTVEATPGIDLVSLDIANDGTYDTMTLTALLKIVSSGGSNQGKLEGLGFTGEQTGQILGGVSCQTGGATAGYNTAQMLGSNVQGQILGAAGAMGWGGNNNTDDVFRGQCYRSGKRALWAKMLGAWENQDAVAGQTEAFNTNLFGIQFGADRAFGRSLVGGIAASGAWARTNSNSAHNNTDLFDVQLYGAANLRRGWMLSSSLGYQYMNFNGTRTVSSDIYNSTHAGNMLKGGFQLEKEFNCCGIDVSPIYGWEYYGLWQDAYSETSPTGNISGAGMTLEADSSYALYQRLGGRLALLRKRRLSVDVTTSWLHNFGDANITMIGTIAAGNAISLVGAPMHRNLAELEFDATYELTRRLGLTVGYTGRFANGYDLHTVDGMLRWDF